MTTPESRDYTLQEIVDIIPYDVASQIDRAQKVHIKWPSLDPDIEVLLASNTGYYESDIEDHLDLDPVLSNIIIDDRHGATPEQKDQIRARRTIAIRMILEAAAVSVAMEQHPASQDSAA